MAKSFIFKVLIVFFVLGILSLEYNALSGYRVKNSSSIEKRIEIVEFKIGENDNHSIYILDENKQLILFEEPKTCGCNVIDKFTYPDVPKNEQMYLIMKGTKNILKNGKEKIRYKEIDIHIHELNN